MQRSVCQCHHSARAHRCPHCCVRSRGGAVFASFAAGSCFYLLLLLPASPHHGDTSHEQSAVAVGLAPHVPRTSAIYLSNTIASSAAVTQASPFSPLSPCFAMHSQGAFIKVMVLSSCCEVVSTASVSVRSLSFPRTRVSGGGVGLSHYTSTVTLHAINTDNLSLQ